MKRALAMVAVVLCGGLVACTSSDDDIVVQDDGPIGREAVLELAPVDGMEPIGHEIRYETESDNGDVTTHLLAAYRITGDDPLEVMEAYVEEAAGVGVGGTLQTDRPGRGGSWLITQDEHDDPADAVAAGIVYLDLWATEDDPVLLVSVSRRSDEGERSRVGDFPDSANEPAPVDGDERGPGDVLFIEQGDAIHLPEGTRTITPTFPTPGGTGGSTTLISADDEDAAIAALIDEGLSHDSDAYVDEPEVSDFDGLRIVTAYFGIPAGGWDMQIVAARGPDDDTATIWVMTSAD